MIPGHLNPPFHPPKKIACGLYHSASVCNVTVDKNDNIILGEGSCYVWGRNKWNTLGLGSEEHDYLVPERLEQKFVGIRKTQDIHEVACGVSHSVFLVKCEEESRPSKQMPAPRMTTFEGRKEVGGSKEVADPAGAAARGNDGCVIYACGLGNRGRLGVAEKSERESVDLWCSVAPCRVDLPQCRAIRVVCGADHTLCLSTTGVLYAWGLNDDGQCGVGRTGDLWHPTPVEFKGPIGHFAAGSRHSMLLVGHGEKGNEDSLGQLYSWGFGGDGRLGNGSFETVLVPRRADANIRFRTIACGEAHSGGISDHRLFMWGAGSHGRLGMGEEMNLLVPREIETLSGSGVSQIALGAFHSVAASKRLNLFAWGSGEATGIVTEGEKTVVDRPRSVALPKTINGVPLLQLIQISAGFYHTLLLFEGGQILAFGMASSGRLGIGKFKTKPIIAPVYALPQRPVGFAMKIKDNKGTVLRGRLKDWTDNDIEQGSRVSDEKARAKGSWALQQVACGSAHSMALTKTGEVYVWGSAGSGQLGLGKSEQEEVPPVCWHPKLLTFPMCKYVVRIAVGYEHCLAITDRGAVLAWGKGSSGQLGVGISKSTFVPEQVLVHGEALYCAAGDEHSAVIVRNRNGPGNVLYTFGGATSGKLGLGIDQPFGNDQWTPREVFQGLPCKEDDSPVFVSCGQDHTAVICGHTNARVRGSLYTFGSGWHGRLGHGDMQNQYVPKRVQWQDMDEKKIRVVSCGAYHTCAVDIQSGDKNGGFLWVWGRGSDICEHSDATEPMVFTRIEGQPLMIGVFCGHEHTLCVTAESLEVYGWGDNSSSQLGLGQNAPAHFYHPEPMKALPGIVTINEEDGFPVMATGALHSLAYLTDAKTYGWGNQSCGRLGLESVNERKHIGNPAKVKSEWSSIESMGGKLATEEKFKADLSDEETGSEANVSSQSSAGGMSQGVDGAGESEKKLTLVNRMLQAVESGQKLQRFSTLQILLKREPTKSKEESLHAAEEDLEKSLQKFMNHIFELPAKEKVMIDLQAELAQSLNHNLPYLKNQVPPDLPTHVNPRFGSKLKLYGDLVWVLQQQGAYMASLSMCLEGKDEVETFHNIVRGLYGELTNDRVRHLFLAMMKAMISKEVEISKNLVEVFNKERSRALHTFSYFALHEIHYKKVVHPIMDYNLRPTPQCPHKSLLACIVDYSGNTGQMFALTREDFVRGLQNKLAPDLGRELHPAEITTEFMVCVDKFRDFVLNEALPAIKGIDIPSSLLTIFHYCASEIRQRHFLEAHSLDRVISSELKVLEPLVGLLVEGIMLPLLSKVDKYCGKQVFLSKCKEEVFQEALTLHNINTFASFLEGMDADSFDPKANKTLDSLAKSVKLELLKYLMVKTIKVQDRTLTNLTIDAYAAHFDRSRYDVSLSASSLMKLSNMLADQESKIRVRPDDVLEELCKGIGRWTPAEIAAMQSNDCLHNFQMKTRFLWEERWGKSMTICKSSQCPVPSRLASSSGGNSESCPGVGIQKFSRTVNQYHQMEELFREVDLLNATNFAELSDELAELIHGQQKSSNPDATVKMQLCLNKVRDLLLQEENVIDFLQAMVDIVMARDMHRQYLEALKEGISAIDEQRRRHEAELEIAKREVRAMISASQTLKSPDILYNRSREIGKELKFFRLAKHFSKVKDVTRKPLKGISIATYETYPLTKLLQTNVVLEPVGTLLKAQPNSVLVKMCCVSTGVDVTVSIRRGHVKSILQQFRIAQEAIDEMRRATEGTKVMLPLDQPVLLFDSQSLVALIENLSRR